MRSTLPSLRKRLASSDRIPAEDDPYWQRIRDWAADLDSDGCTGVPDFHLDACLEHDCHYRTHHWLDGTPIFKSEADARLRQVIQSRSFLGILSPMAWWRWGAVALMGKWAWEGKKM